MPGRTVVLLHQTLTADGLEATPLEDERPADDYVTFRCRDPDGTEIEVFWERPR